MPRAIAPVDRLSPACGMATAVFEAATTPSETKTRKIKIREDVGASVGSDEDLVAGPCATRLPRPRRRRHLHRPTLVSRERSNGVFRTEGFVTYVCSLVALQLGPMTKVPVWRKFNSFAMSDMSIASTYSGLPGLGVARHIAPPSVKSRRASRRESLRSPSCLLHQTTTRSTASVWALGSR